MPPKTYRCENPACSLGTVGSPGLFTGGITKEQATLLTGDPDPEHGKGVCPNCGKPGVDHDPNDLVRAHLEDQIDELEAQLKEVSK